MLFHFYANPIVNIKDYFSLTFDSQEEFPSLSPPEPTSPQALVEINEEGISFDETKNAIIYFEGHEYKVLSLKALIKSVVMTKASSRLIKTVQDTRTFTMIFIAEKPSLGLLGNVTENRMTQTMM